jgi:hypothetical protein
MKNVYTNENGAPDVNKAKKMTGERNVKKYAEGQFREKRARLSVPKWNSPRVTL